jgi:subtilase family serine protease
MRPRGVRVAVIAALLTLLVFLVAAPGDTQTPSRNRIAGPIDDATLAVVRGTAHPLAQARFDRGRTRVDRIIQAAITFRLSAAQQSDLDQLLREQQDRSSPNYHRWLTPDQYAIRFGMSQNDLARVTGWLQSQGLTVEEISRDRNEIFFHGTALQVEYALKTEFHDYSVNGEQHFANSTDISLPSAFSSHVLGVRGLTNFSPKPRARRISPRFTSSLSGNHFVIPGDFATIYHLNSLYSQGLDGAGQTIAVVGQTTISLSDIDAFRAAAGLPKYEPTLQLVPNTGAATNCPSDVTEADLDVEWAGAVAKNASIIYVFAGVGTGACGNSRTKTVFDALQYAITNNLAPIISISYGNCEANLPIGIVNTIRQWAQQANSHGQTISGPSGDDGAADCDNNVSSATSGLAVDVPASIPEVTGVGGTEFTGDASQCPGNPPSCPAGGSPADPPYWSASSSLTSGASALTYIPETTWNDTTQSLALVPPQGFSATGGGASTIFTKTQAPWQAGPGVPADGKRDVPDIAFNGSNFHDPYLFCTAGSCVNGFRDASNGLSGVGGTSVGAPTFAGLLAIINQATQSSIGQGNVNPNLYSLAVSTPSAFNDIANGNNKVPCTQGSTGCPSGGSIGFAAGPNYDQVTGLGSIDGFNLVTSWPGFSSAPTFALGASPLAITVASAGQGASAQLVAGGSSGFTGSVNLTCDVGSAASAQVSCSVSPASVSLSAGTTSGAATLTIHTAAASAAMSQEDFGVLAASLAFPAMFFLGAPMTHRKRIMRLLTVGLLAVIVGCGGGSGGGSKSPGTPAGTYAVTVTGTSNSTSHTANISFTVQ